jgi:Arc/MetJ-type ribon-helix-helix transcriptional regulator
MDENQATSEDEATGRRPKALRDRARVLVALGNTVGESIRDALEGRDNVVAVRVNDDSLTAIDALVEAGLFKTRSEAAAFLIHEGIRAKADILQRVQDTVGRITKLREELKNILGSEPAGAAPAAEAAAQEAGQSERVDLSPAV